MKEVMLENKGDYSWKTVNQNFLLPRSLDEREAVNGEFARNQKHSRLIKNLGHLDFAYQIFSNNHREFQQLCAQEESSFSADQSVVTNQFFEDRFRIANLLSQKLTNFLGSMRMLVDITRKILNNEENYDQIKKDLQQQVIQLHGATGIRELLDDLRNYVLHVGVVVLLPYAWDGSKKTLLDTTELKNWSGLSKQASGFVLTNEMTHPNYPDVVGLEAKRILQVYSDAQSKLTAWLFNSVLRQEKPTVIANNELIAKLRREQG